MEQHTFAERIQTLKDIAEHLRSYAETILIEAQRMEAIQNRFADRGEKRFTPRRGSRG